MARYVIVCVSNDNQPQEIFSRTREVLLKQKNGYKIWEFNLWHHPLAMNGLPRNSLGYSVCIFE